MAGLLRAFFAVRGEASSGSARGPRLGTRSKTLDSRLRGNDEGVVRAVFAVRAVPCGAVPTSPCRAVRRHRRHWLAAFLLRLRAIPQRILRLQRLRRELDAVFGGE